MASSLESTFSSDDIETLIDSLTDWEISRNQEFHFMEMIKSAPMPPEDHEAYEMMLEIKNQFRSRERDIIDSRMTRQEKAVMLKAKLMLTRRELAIDQLFDFATSNPTDTNAEATKGVEVSPKPKTEAKTATVKTSGGQKTSLKIAEQFIQEVGIWEHYQKFLDERETD